MGEESKRVGSRGRELHLVFAPQPLCGCVGQAGADGGHLLLLGWQGSSTCPQVTTSKMPQQKQQSLTLFTHYSSLQTTSLSCLESRCLKGTTIGDFLAQIKEQIEELEGTSSSNLLFVKEDVIIPHHFSFHELITTRARGRNGWSVA
jgi:hypothetical protein